MPTEEAASPDEPTANPSIRQFDPNLALPELTELTVVSRDDEVGGALDLKAPTPRSLDDQLRTAGSPTLCAGLMIQEALRRQPDFMMASLVQGSLTVIEAPSTEWTGPIHKAWKIMTDHAIQTAGVSGQRPRASKRQRENRRESSAPEPDIITQTAIELPVILEAEANEELSTSRWHRSSSQGLGLFSPAIQAMKPVHAIATNPAKQLPPLVLLVADRTLTVEPPNHRVAIRLAMSLARETKFAAGTGSMKGHIRQLRKLAPSTLPFQVAAVRRPGQTADAYLQRLLAVLEKVMAASPPGWRRSSVILEHLFGLGEARKWGDQLAHDLRLYAEGQLAWSEVDKGVVLEGPPGCGKTLFAQALANSSQVSLVVASYAQWQGTRDGHLGDTLAAMKASFQEARKAAPCILLIDEVDSLPDRGTLPAINKDYLVAVVNGLLEQLDGALGREGVVVVGACNNASFLDPALTRAGRLEKVIQIPFPDAPAIEGILRVHLKDDLVQADLAEVARAAAERHAVGADIELWCRNARRRARLERRALEIADLAREIGDASSPRTPDQMWRTAVHEAGHVVAYNAISPDLVIRVRISRHNDDVVGSLTELSNDALMASVRQITMAGVRQQLVALLAGRAAEIELIGAASGGSGGASNSDLARATRIAVQALACCGLGDVDLTYRGEANHVLNPKFLDGDRELRQEVSWLLSSCHDEARQLVRERREALTYVAKRMVEDLELSAAQLKTLLDDCRAHESSDITGGDVDTHATPLASSRCEVGAATTSSATTTPTAPIIGNPGHPEVGNDL